MVNIAGKVFLVTGASSGIGEAISRALISHGAGVVAMARREDKLVALQETAGGPENLAIAVGDVTQPDARQQAIEIALARFGRLDGVIHSAGVSQRSRAAETGLEVFRSLMEINYFAAIGLIQAALPELRKRHGHIVVISSVAGRFSTPMRSGYAASKHAVEAFLDALRLELREENLHVLTVSPGFVKTEITLHALTADGTALNRMEDETANGLSPDVVAEQVVAAIAARRRAIAPTGRPERLALFLSRWAPGLLERMLWRRYQRAYLK